MSTSPLSPSAAHQLKRMYAMRCINNVSPVPPRRRDVKGSGLASKPTHRRLNLDSNENIGPNGSIGKSRDMENDNIVVNDSVKSKQVKDNAGE